MLFRPVAANPAGEEEYMLKYWGDFVEKLAAGTLLIAFFHERGNLVVSVAGLLMVTVWLILRIKETKKGRAEK
jgi:hypothetical protein